VTKVLYVEHSDDNRYMLKTRLERVGDFEVLPSNDSEDGCRLAQSELSGSAPCNGWRAVTKAESGSALIRTPSLLLSWRG
jgi:hypothetical protein